MRAAAWETESAAWRTGTGLYEYVHCLYDTVDIVATPKATTHGHKNRFAEEQTIFSVTAKTVNSTANATAPLSRDV